MIVLIGFMGAGKTTVGRLLSERLGIPFVDIDEAIERDRGMAVADIFRTQGEGMFRTLERDAVTRALEGPDRVVSLGGGAVTDPTTCAALEWHTVIHLDVGYPEAMRRVGRDPGRPLLDSSDPRALFDERASTYQRLATHVIGTDEVPIEAVVDSILDAAGLAVAEGPARVEVELGGRSYPIFVGSDISGQANDLVDVGGSRHAFIVTHPDLAELAKPLIDSLSTSSLRVTSLSVDEGESSKRLEVAAGLLEDLAAHRADRSDLIVGFGGGVVCDLAGFVGSTYHRGMRTLHVPTTLLAQVDAAIGGKTGVNLIHGKNLVGTIHQPIAVICDVALLRTLPEEEIRSGLAEVIKYGFIADPMLLTIVREGAEALLGRDERILADVVRRGAAIKAAVVAADETETGRREILNYGHTFGHAIEHVTGIRHGEAISLGMIAAAELALTLGMIDRETKDLHRDCLGTVGLPTRASFDIDEALEALMQDKKHRGVVRFVLLENVGAVRTGVEATDEQIRAALRSVNR